MAFSTTRGQRNDCRRATRTLVTAVLATALLQIFIVNPSVAQVTPPAKKHFKAAPRPRSDQASPSDTQADQLNDKWLSEFNKSAADKAGADKPGAPGSPANAPAQATTAPATGPTPASQAALGQATPSQSSATGAMAVAPRAAASVVGTEDERTSSVPSMAMPLGAGSRTVVPGSASYVKLDSADAIFNSVPAGANQPVVKDFNKAFAGFAPGATKIEVMRGQTVDGSMRLLYASIGEGPSKQSYWWFSPPDQPQGWFDSQGKRLGGGTLLAEPKPNAIISSPFGNRRYYGRTSGAGFHNGIDFEGKVGDPIYAAGDGVVNHVGWYYNYGRTVKISHADNFETLYAHMSGFAPGLTPGTTVHKGDVIGFVGSTGRSTGPHLHFSTIVDGQFVDPTPYISLNGGNSRLTANALVAFRQWQQELHSVALAKPGSRRANGAPQGSGLQGGAMQVGGMQSATVQGAGDNWSNSPFAPRPFPGHL